MYLLVYLKFFNNSYIILQQRVKSIQVVKSKISFFFQLTASESTVFKQTGRPEISMKIQGIAATII